MVIPSALRYQVYETLTGNSTKKDIGLRNNCANDILHLLINKAYDLICQRPDLKIGLQAQW